MAGIVLAGGKSARMGSNKAQLRIGDITLLERVVEIVQSVVRPVIVVADRADRYRLPNARTVPDLVPDAGPLGGLVTGLMEAGRGRHVVVACDMPCLHPELLQLLLETVGEADAAVPEVRGHWEPLCAVYRGRCVGRLRAFLETRRFALHRALQTLSVRYIGEEELRRADPDLRSFININTPDDYRALGEQDD